MSHRAKAAPPRAVLLYAAVAFVLLGAAGMHRAATRSTPDATAYHAHIKSTIEAIPYRFGDWTGENVQVPAAAIALLRPNVLVGRAYRSPAVNGPVTLMVVQCHDTRDLAGHYPPICYRANGWQPTVSQEGLRIPGVHLAPIARYGFERPTDVTTTGVVVYNALVLPGAGAVPSMSHVRDAAANPQTRAYGAAQIQVIVPVELSEAEQHRIVGEFLNSLDPLLESLSTRP